MKLSIRLAVLASLCLYVQLFAQPNGTNYVRQSDFGDAQNTIYPNASGDWIYLSFWNDVQTLSTQSDWFGPNYELDSSSHPHYVMLDDAPSDYGALAGQLINLEYRLVEVNFDYLTYNERNTDLNTTDGKLHVLLCTSENDVRSFDPNNPSLFETSGTGQVLMTINFQGGPTNGLDLTAWNSTGSSSSRRAYALSKSQTGTPGNPFTYVGLVWESEFEETRLLLDNFRITDICPDCQMRPVVQDTGCFDNNWITPIPNNYYYYTVAIRDVSTSTTVFQEIHQPATFNWNGVGNTGTWNGTQVAYGQQLVADITYYSCLRGASNIVRETYRVTRRAGCVDPSFGGSKLQLVKDDQLTIGPNPISSGMKFRINWEDQEEEMVDFLIFDLNGSVVRRLGNGYSIKGENEVTLSCPEIPTGIYLFAVKSKSEMKTVILSVL